MAELSTKGFAVQVSFLPGGAFIQLDYGLGLKIALIETERIQAFSSDSVLYHFGINSVSKSYIINTGVMKKSGESLSDWVKSETGLRRVLREALKLKVQTIKENGTFGYNVQIENIKKGVRTETPFWNDAPIPLLRSLWKDESVWVYDNYSKVFVPKDSGQLHETVFLDDLELSLRNTYLE